MTACLAILAVSGILGCADTPVQVPADTISANAAGTDSVALTYICGNMFRIRNSAFDPRSVRWDIYNAVPAETGSLRARGRDVGSAFVDYFVTARTNGTMRLFVGSTLIATKANGNKAACAAPLDTTPLSTARQRSALDPAREPSFYDPSDSTANARTIVNVTFVPTASAASIRDFQRKFLAQLVTVSRSYLQFRIPDPGPLRSAIDSVLSQIRAHAAVSEAAYVTTFGPIRTDGAIYPNDGPGLLRADYLSANSETWASRSLRLPQAWWCENGTYGLSRPRIAVLEQNFSALPSDFQTSASATMKRFSVRFDSTQFPPNAAKRDSLERHGIEVAALIGGVGGNGVGIAGVMWNSDLRLLSLQSVSEYGADADFFARTVVPELRAIRPRVLSLSSDFGPYSNLAKYAFNLRAASDGISELLDSLPGLLIVQSSGNEGISGNAAQVPVSKRAPLREALLSLKASDSSLAKRIIHVGASTRNGNRAGFSNELLGALDVYAPGDKISSLSAEGTPFEVTGTSFATPLVAGIAAQLLAMDSTLAPADVKSLILAGARDSVENSNGDNIAPNPVGNTSGVVYEADAYGSLRVLSSRAGEPLCGATVTTVRIPVYPRYQFNPAFSLRIHRYQSTADDSVTTDANAHALLWPGNYDAFDVLDVAPGGRALSMTSAVVAGSTNMQTNIIRLTNGQWRTASSTTGAGGMLFGERDTLLLDANSATFATTAGRGAAIPWPDAEVYPGRVSFAPDGSRFAYAVVRNGGAELVVVNRSAQVQRLSLAVGTQVNANRTSWSPDSRTIIASTIQYPGGDFATYYNLGIATAFYRIAVGTTLTLQTQRVIRGFNSYSFLEAITPTDEGGRFKFRLIGENARGTDSPGYGDPLFLRDCAVLSVRTNTFDGELSLLELSPPACPAGRPIIDGGGGGPVKVGVPRPTPPASLSVRKP